MSAFSKIVRLFFRLAQNIGGEVAGEKNIAPELASCARELAAEGIVLLKNDGALPIGDDEVALFGRVQQDYFCVGYGSGGDVKAPYKVNLVQGLKGVGIKLNPEVDKYYRDWCASNIPDEGFWGHWPMCFEEAPIADELVRKASQSAKTAIAVIGRAAGEDREQKLEKGSFYLTDGEIEMLDKVTKAFDKVVLVIDAGNIIDLSFLEGYGDKISAVLYAFQGGMESGNAVADVISGRVNPSGRLTDTIARTYSDYPSSENFGNKKFNNYCEDIYVGYRYFETFARECVLFPFGYGLSYTDFATSCVFDCDLENKRFEVEATIVNTGKRAGKEVVQVYVEMPQGRLGKPLRSLVGFKKTALIGAGEADNATISVALADIASYDDGGLTGNPSCFVLEQGEYRVYVGSNAREAQLVGKFSLDETIVVKEAEEICPPDKKHAFEVLYPKGESGEFTKGYRPVATRTSDLRERIEARLPSALVSRVKMSFGEVRRGERTLSEFVATLSDEDLESLTHGDLKMNSPLGAIGNAGAFGGITEQLRKKGVPPVTVTDGPSGIRLNSYASLLPSGTAIASSFNEELAERLYSLVAVEMNEKGTQMLLAPGMNLHRDPLCGRNFEYFSEDPLVSGKIAAAVVRGVQSGGVSACPKHFACNNQETARAKNDSRVSERALRELYFKSFEICIKESKPLCIMTSYNKINGVYSYHNYDLATTLLRKEWGYEGLVITDWWTKRAKNPNFKGVDDNAYRIRAQVDVLMPGGGSRLSGKYSHSARLAYGKGFKRSELQRSAENTLRFILNCKATKDKIG